MEKAIHIQAIKNSMDNAKQSGLKLNVRIIGHGCCRECDKIDQQIISFEDAEKKPPIPHPACARPSGCNCTIGFISVRDGNGKLIKN